jgi:hypothetical protein
LGGAIVTGPVNIDQDSATEIPGADMPNKTDIATHKISLTFFRDEYAKSLTVKSMTLPRLRDEILATKGPTKAAMPWLKGARFGDKRTDKGNLRSDENVLGFDAIELDYDQMVISFDEAVAKLRSMNVRALVYTTPTHTAAAPRWRVLLPVSRDDLAVDARGKMCARVNGRFGRVFADESFTLSQSYYYGLALDNPAPDHRCEVIDGRFVDLCNDLWKYQDGGFPKQGEGKKKGNGKAKGKSHDEDEKFNALLATLGDGDGLNGFHKVLVPATAAYAYQHGTNLDREVLKTKLREAINGAPKGATRKADDITGYLSDEYLDGIIASAIEKYGTEQEDVLRLNRTRAILPIGDKTRVVTFGELPAFPGRETIVMTQSISDFKSLQDRYRHTYCDVKTGEEKHVPMGTHWIKSPKRRQYDGGMAFMPQRDGDAGNKLNLWRGFGVKPIKPVPGSRAAIGCKKFLDFMRDTICNGNEEHFQYLLKREATIFQKRIRSEVAVGLQTKKEGCGKGFYEKHIGHLLGSHAMQVTNPKHIIGNFNPHLETLLRLTADEALFVGNHEHRNALFGLITEGTLTIEPKGCGLYKADSYLNISITSNSDHFLPVSDSSRRFFIPTVSTKHQGDTAYFGDLEADLLSGGHEALLYYLLNEVDLTDFNVRKVPQTEGLREQRGQSLEPLDVWWVELLETGVITGSDPANPNQAVSNAYQREIKVAASYKGDASTHVRLVTQLGIFDQARQISPKLRNISFNELGGHLAAMGCHRGRVLRKRGWIFPSLGKCRQDWVKRFPGWTWQNNITAWCPEEGDDVTSHDADPARHAEFEMPSPGA